MKTLIPMALAAGSLAFLPAPALASHGPGGPDFERGEMQLYACEGGFKITVTRLQVLGESAMQVGFPTGRNDNLTALQLLPATQTGSGVRYASDITSFHEKGDTAIFRTEASAKSEAIPSSTCTLERSGPPAPASETPPAPHTQTARNGSYWVKVKPGYGADPSAPPTYIEIENVCITPDGKRFFGIHPAVGDEPAFAITEDGPLMINIGEVDASAGKRHYRINNPGNVGEYLTMNFITPGMREADQPSATAGLLSITGDDRQVDCIDNDAILMMATFGTEAITVAAEDGELVLREAPDIEQNTFEASGGLLAHDGNFAELHFLKGGDLITIDLSRDGQTEGFRLKASGSEEATLKQPQAYFIADPEALSAFASQSSKDLGQLVTRLTACNHFAGEASEDVERNAQIAEKIAQYRCMELPAEYDAALVSLDGGSDLYSYLTAHSPSWR